MKTKIFLTASIIIAAAIPAFAEISAKESTNPEYLQNYGYSSSMVEMVQINKASVMGERYITDDEARHANDSKPVKWIRKIFTYFDPALDDGTFMRHDIKNSPSIDDL